ncbi:MAG: Calx-beta domain-containing protein [Verrucomicrobiia bacterium]
MLGVPLIVIGWALTVFSGLTYAQTGAVTFSQSAYSVNVNQGSALITVAFTGSTDGVATVDFATSDGTGTAGVNYVTSTGTVTFATNVLSATFTVPVLDNGVSLSTQTVNLALSNPTGFAVLGSPSNAVLTIINTTTQQVQFAQAAYTVDEGGGDAVITVVRTGGSNGTVSVDFSTSDGSAKAGIDYMATAGTVTFGEGVLTNTVTIPILESSPLETNQTVHLTLSHPQGCALSNPKNAVLTIVATGPPTIQFGAANYHVHEHVGKATLTVLRFGDSSGAASVDYATSDGTAKNGTDYLGTSGTLVFPSGAESASFSFQFVEFRDFQSNKTVIATLSNTNGANLGTQVTAVVTIVNDRPQTIAFTSGAGDSVTMTLQRAGTMQISTNDPPSIVLSDTDATSLLTIRVKKGGAGTGVLSVDGITGDGDCRSINAPGVDLVGSGVQVSGYLKQLQVHDILNGAAVTAGGAADQDTKIVAHNIGDDATIDLGSRIQTLQAARFGAGTINAPRIAKMLIKGDRRNGIPGDCEASFTLSGDGVPAGDSTLGTLVVAGAISNASINIANGNVGSVAASEMVDSTIYVGFTPGDPSNPLLGGTFVPDLRLGSLRVKSSVNGFVDSDIAAAIIGSVHLGSAVTNNAGLPFGVLGNQSISSVTVKTPSFKWSRTGAADQSSGDFQVIQP